MAGRTVVVMGGGTGGLVAARELRRRLASSDRVVLIDRSSAYSFAPSFLWVMTGARRPAQVTADLRRLRRKGIEVLTSEVRGIDVDGRRVDTADGAVAYDRLVISLGIELAPEALPGFVPAAHNVYDLPGALAAGRALRAFEGSRVAVLVSRLPYKCPAGPYETALLAESVLRKRGIREGSTVDVYTPEPLPMPTAGPVLGEALLGILRDRDIGFHPERTVERIEPEARELVFGDGEPVEFDLLLGVPPQRAPQVARESGLAAESGFLPVDRATLETSAEGVYAIGDVTTIPIAGGKFLPKAGVFAHAEAEVVARRIADELSGRVPAASFDGKGSCFVEMGDGVAAFATGDFYAGGAPEVSLKRPGRRWHLSKIAFEQYWMRRWF